MQPAAIWPRSPRLRGPIRGALADRTFSAITANGYGEYDELISLLVPALGPDGIEHLKARVSEMAQRSVPMPLDNERTVIRHGPAVQCMLMI